MTRLFSNLLSQNEELKHRPGSIINCTALVAGTTVGAGILALPAVTLPIGLLPSSILLIAIWGYALITGLLLVEVNLKTICTLGRPSSGLLAMARCSLGKTGTNIASIAYVFLHYALLVAYIAEGGEILLSPFPNLPAYLGVSLFVALFGGLVYLGSDRFIHQCNNIFVVVVTLSFFGLLSLGIERVNIANFSYHNWMAFAPAIPIMLVALFYHNIIPAIASELEGDFRKIRFCLVAGSLIPLLMFLAWNAVILGGVSSEVIAAGETLIDPIEILREGSSGKGLGIIVSVFSEFAIVTSFIGFVYGLRDFYTDIWHPTAKPTQKLRLYSLILLPAMTLAVLNPTIFFKALDYAGTFSISLLGGIIPVWMVWKQRYNLGVDSAFKVLVPGGKLLLISITIISLGIMFQEFV